MTHGRDLIRGLLGEEVAAALAAALLLAAIEAALVAQVGAILVAVALLVALGFAVGAVWALAEEMVRRHRLGATSAAAVRALAALPPLVFVARHLFEGARASALPGAELGTLWVPALGVLLLFAVVFTGARLLRAGHASRRLALALACAGFAAAAELANRKLFRSEYPDVHVFLIVAALAALAVAIRLGAGAGPSLPRRPRWLFRGGAAAVAVVSVVAALLVGLGARESRWAVATRGTHARELSHLARAAFDRDGDGFSTVLGGGDCDDGDASVNPGAPEILGNGVDEDCDGEDLDSIPAPSPRRARAAAEARAELLARPDVADLLERTRGMNVLVVLIDSLRADVVKDSERNRDAFPEMFSFLDRARRFRYAFASSAGTDLSVSSAITGRINPLEAVDTTLPEALRQSGRATGAILPREVLRYAGEVLLGRGIDRMVRYVNDHEERDVGSHTTSVKTTDLALRALDRLEGGDRPFYLWVHYFDVHEHHQVENHDSHLQEVAAGFDLSRRAGKYRALLALTDREIGRLLDALVERGLAERTIVVLLSDHGESLGEDPRLPDAHGRFVYNALTHVPLAIRIPGVEPAEVLAPISLIDVAPTLVELAGLEPLSGADGVSLLPHLVERPPPELAKARRPIVMNEQEQWGIILWPMKLMVRPADNLTELYDLEEDFGERRDLSGERPDVVRRLKRRYLSAPRVTLDRTRAGRRARDRAARPPRPGERER